MFACCDDEEATGEVGVLAVTVVAGIFPTGALDLRQGATILQDLMYSETLTVTVGTFRFLIALV